MADRNPAMDALDVLVGRWSVQPEVEGVPAAPVVFAWSEELHPRALDHL